MPLLNHQVNYDILGDFIASQKGNAFMDNIPELTRENIREVGNAILDYQPTKDAFYNEFMVKITLQLFDGMTGQNKFAFLKGKTNLGDIEDAYVDYIKGETFNPNDTNPFAIRKADVKTLYHKVDRKLVYDTTVSDEQLRNAFLTEYGLSNLIQKVINTLYESAEWDEYTMVKQLFVDNFDKGYKVPITGSSKSEVVERLLYNMKKYSQNLTFNSRDYNHLGVVNNTSYDNQIIVLHKDYALDIDMGVLANTFNIDRMKLDGRVIIVDNFNTTTPNVEGGTPTNIVAMIGDRRGFRIHDALRKMETQRNAKALYTNYFLHVWGLMSYAYFYNLVYFTEPTELEE